MNLNKEELKELIELVMEFSNNNSLKEKLIRYGINKNWTFIIHYLNNNILIDHHNLEEIKNIRRK